ncbi:MAG: hypothetical protein M3O09_06885 [Acidobacteriota bacterium]|nr:hypothetical protein [Acidobacteriota bacterium]
MESERWEVVQLELKYCERCGGLWIRALNSPIVYCAPCAIEMTQVAVPRRRTVKTSSVVTPVQPASRSGREVPRYGLTLVAAEAGTA